MATVPKKPRHGAVFAALGVSWDHNNNTSKRFKSACGKKEGAIDKRDNKAVKVPKSLMLSLALSLEEGLGPGLGEGKRCASIRILR
jgi:hypothetical protein